MAARHTICRKSLIEYAIAKGPYEAANISNIVKGTDTFEFAFTLTVDKAGKVYGAGHRYRREGFLGKHNPPKFPAVI